LVLPGGRRAGNLNFDFAFWIGAHLFGCFVGFLFMHSQLNATSVWNYRPPRTALQPQLQVVGAAFRQFRLESTISNLNWQN
jgi:hypothetical protein